MIIAWRREPSTIVWYPVEMTGETQVPIPARRIRFKGDPIMACNDIRAWIECDGYEELPDED